MIWLTMRLVWYSDLVSGYNFHHLSQFRKDDTKHFFFHLPESTMKKPSDRRRGWSATCQYFLSERS